MSDYFDLPLGHTYCPLRKKYDGELVEFFAGFEYRHDIIDRIDQEVYQGVQDLSYGRPVPVSLRKLICYALWGNPVDAYKWFEYSYQQEYMPHHYLPEHVILGHIQDPVKASGPQASVDVGYKKHGDVRHRMARANDQGVGKLILTDYCARDSTLIHITYLHRCSYCSSYRVQNGACS